MLHSVSGSFKRKTKHDGCQDNMIKNVEKMNLEQNENYEYENLFYSNTILVKYTTSNVLLSAKMVEVAILRTPMSWMLDLFISIYTLLSHCQLYHIYLFSYLSILFS